MMIFLDLREWALSFIGLIARSSACYLSFDGNFTINITGRKIKLRDWSLEDVAAFEYWQKPGHDWQKTDGPYYRDGSDNSKSQAQKLKQEIEKRDFQSPRDQLVIANFQDNKILGTVVSYWESKETNWLCIGITIYDSQNSWGKGFGFEALGLWIDYLFQSRPEIVRLDMRTWSGNQGLMKLAAKLGFQQEACFRKARIVNGKYYDGLGFGILREEWAHLHPQGFLADLE